MTRRNSFRIAAMALVLVAGTAQAQVYERWRKMHSPSFLPAELQKSDVHEVKGRVFTEGYMHEYRVASPYGEFGASGDAMLRRLVRELHAIKAMEEVSGTEAFADATVEVLKSPYAALKALATDPVATVSGVPKGIGRVFEGIGESLAGDESEYEDNEVEALLTLSKFKRQYSAELGIDVYSSNPVVQTELNRIGWSAAIGNFTPSILTMPISGPVIVVAKSLDWVDALNDALVEKAPSALRVDNTEYLEKMGIDEALITRFLDHPLYSPRHETVIVYALHGMEGVRGREHILRLALDAESEVQALSFQQLAEMLAGYHRERSPIVEIRPFRNLVVSKTKNGNLVVMAPLDEGRWTLRAARAMHELTSNPPGGTPNGFELIVTGTLSDRTRKKTQAMGIDTTERANVLFGLLD
ncbi:MAG: hypothetical protein JRH01_18645 [Deltaproteobacteria bacterium]|nr:hypothetical protein [Deltaproteobacteria bacterium]MBW2395618.1 hypothetical protein [Deltaproteobacteria bacterium]